MSAVTLDTIRQAADAKYGSYDIDLGDGSITRLLNPLRMSEEARAELKKVQRELSASVDDDAPEDVSQVTLFEKAITIVAETEGQAKRLLKLVKGDLAVLASIFEAYGENAQVGEASASAT
jgi:hypothetical protein